MATRVDIARQQERLKLKKEQLDLRIKKHETTQRLKDITEKLKRIGGRIR
jgi:hypothetical protein